MGYYILLCWQSKLFGLYSRCTYRPLEGGHGGLSPDWQEVAQKCLVMEAAQRPGTA
jgi:hypothetical protein